MPRSSRFITPARALTCCLVFALAWSALALADTARFEIRAEPLSLGLKAFAQQAHMQLLYEYDIVRDVRCNPVIGIVEKRAALTELLRNTGLEAVFNSENAATIRPIAKSTSMSRDGKGNGLKKNTADAHHLAQIDETELTPPSPPRTKSAATHEVVALQEVIVTGTHIRGLVPAYPVTAVSRDDILESGRQTVGDVLRASPLIFSGGMNPGALQGPSSFNTGDAGTGVSTANLLGIGPDATLTLIDGRRLSGTGELPSGDLSLIPLVAVQSVEIQTGGSSAVYGSEAVAGVVNVILRRDYDGAETSAYDGWTEGGGDFTQRYSQLFGKTLDKGSVLVAAELDKSDPLSADQRPISNAVGAIQYLEPQQRSLSLLLNADYSLSGPLSTHVTGLYTHRTAFWSGVEDTLPSRTDEFDSDAGVTYQFHGDSSVGIDLVDGGYNQITYITQLPSMLHQVQAMQDGLFGIDLHGSGTVVELPTGPLSTAAGASFRRENIDVEGNISLASATASRRVDDAYVEMSAPLVTQSATRTGMEALRLDAAGQYSDYSDFGSTKNGMVGVIYTPFHAVTLKATYESSFRAPTLYDLYRPLELALYPGKVFKGAPAGSEVLYDLGGNTDLTPERAHSFTDTLEFSPTFKGIPGRVRAAATYYYIRFTGRIGAPIVNPATALVTPADQPFVISNPTVSQQNSAIAAAGGQLVPVLGASYIPSTVTALVENNQQNVSADVIHGVAANVDYSWNTDYGELGASWAGTWLSFDQRLLANSIPDQISGTVFNPPATKMRGSVRWRRHSWRALVFINHIGTEEFAPPGMAPVEIGSWTTFDSQVGYVINALNHGVGVSLTFSVENVFNKEPPVVPSDAFFADQDLRFDTSNTSPVGRMFALSITVNW